MKSAFRFLSLLLVLSLAAVFAASPMYTQYTVQVGMSDNPTVQVNVNTFVLDPGAQAFKIMMFFTFTNGNGIADAGYRQMIVERPATLEFAANPQLSVAFAGLPITLKVQQILIVSYDGRDCKITPAYPAANQLRLRDELKGNMKRHRLFKLAEKLRNEQFKDYSDIAEILERVAEHGCLEDADALIDILRTI